MNDLSKNVNQVALSIYRYTPVGTDTKPKYETYNVPVNGKMTILQALQYIYEEIDPSLGFRQYCCGVQYCNSCRILVDGRPEHSCLKVIEKEMYLLEPLKDKKIIKDLIVDLDKNE